MALAASQDFNRGDNCSRLHLILDTLEHSLEAGDCESRFPEIEDFGLSYRQIEDIGSDLELFQTVHALKATAFFILAAFSLVFAVVSSSPASLILLVVCLGFAIAGVAALPPSMFAEIFWRNRPDDLAVLTFYFRWSSLKSRHDSAVTQNQIKRELQAAESERVHALRVQFQEELERQLSSRLTRLQYSKPRPIHNPHKFSNLFAGIDEDVKAAFFRTRFSTPILTPRLSC